jgi:hypothetical protein
MDRAKTYPNHVVTAWLGNTPCVAEGGAESGAESGAQVAQNAAQHAHAGNRTESQQLKKPLENPEVLRLPATVGEIMPTLQAERTGTEQVPKTQGKANFFSKAVRNSVQI